MIPVAFLVTVGVFALARISPADPVLVFAGEERDPAALDALRHQLGLDEPMPIQYLAWLSHALQGDLGRSFQSHQRVTEAIVEGAVITETIFFWPGVGRLAVQAIPSHDYPIVQGVVLVSALSFMFSTLLVDVLYGWIDPRISYGSAAA